MAMVIGTVVEGPTDRLVIEAIFNLLFPGDHDFRSLQPLATLGGFGESGGGWKGVRKWCEDVLRTSGLSLDAYMSADAGGRIDALIVHLDVDVAYEDDFQENVLPSEPIIGSLCPPSSSAADLIRRVVFRWMGLGSAAPKGLIFAIPGQDMENWVFAALFPTDELCAQTNFECKHYDHEHPAYLLTLKKYGKHLVRKPPGRNETKPTIKKSVSKYRTLSADVVANWDAVKGVCTQAVTFECDARTVLP